MLESQDIEDREAIPRAENLLLSLEELLAAGLHIGTRIKTVDMERYIFRVRPDGLFILNIGDTNEKIRIAARFMGRFDPGRVLAVSSRLYRSEEHTSELQSRGHLVCRLLLEKKTIIK